MDTDLHSYAATIGWGLCRAGDCTIRRSGHFGQLIMTVIKCLLACLDAYMSGNNWYLGVVCGCSHLVGLDEMVNLWEQKWELVGEFVTIIGG